MSWKFFLAAAAMVLLQANGQITFDCDHKAADIVFVLDSSSSIWEPDFRKQLDFVIGIVTQLNIGRTENQSRVGIITFADRAYLKFHLWRHGNLGSMKKAIKKIQHQGIAKTNTGDAIKYMANRMFRRGYGSRDNVAKVAILITDGHSQKSKQTLIEAEAARAKGIKIYAIGVGDNTKDSELMGIASDPDYKYVFHVENYDELKRNTDLFVDQSCLASTSKPTTTTTTTTMEQTTTVTNDQRDFPEPIIQKCANKPADIYFLLDSSTSIGKINFNITKNFMKRTIRRFAIGPDKTRVGVVAFSTDYDVDIPLGSANDRQSVYTAIDNIPYRYGQTNTHKAIRWARSRGFIKERSRDGVAQILIVLTDGKSNNDTLTKLESKRARDLGMYLFAVGIGSGTDDQELTDIASQPSEKYKFHVSSFGALEGLEEVLARSTCEVLVDLSHHNCGGRERSDILFVYDALNLCKDEVTLISKFTVSAVRGLNMASRNIRIARMLYDINCRRSTSFSNPRDLNVWGNQPLRGLEEMVRSIKSALPDRRKRRNKIAVVFIDQRHHNLEAILSLMQKERSIHFVTVIVGGDTSSKLCTERKFFSSENNNMVICVNDYRALQAARERFMFPLCSAAEYVHIKL